MSSEIKSLMYRAFPLDITQRHAQDILRLVTAYETRGSHPEAFNSPYLGLHKCQFLMKDRDAFLELFSCDHTELAKVFSSLTGEKPDISSSYYTTNFRANSFMRELEKSMKQWLKPFTQLISKDLKIQGVTASDLRKLIAEMSSVDKNFRVASDPMNIFMTYVLHRVANSKLSKDMIKKVLFALVMYLQYKFFTSLVGYRFEHRPDEAVMVAMYESLTMKFDLKVYGTWKKLMEARADAFTNSDSIHWKTLTNYDDDAKILYFITDVQTRLRNQINIITTEFMKAKENHDRIGSYSHVGQDNDGEKIIMGDAQGFDVMVASLFNDALSVPRFLDDQALAIVHGMYGGLPLSKIRAMLIGFSELAVKQTKAGKQQLVEEVNGSIVYTGAQILIQKLIQKTYRYCINAKVDINRAAAILKSTRDVYSSSRVLDEGVMAVRTSVDKLIGNLVDNTRVATLAQYRIVFICYMIILSFRYLR